MKGNDDADHAQELSAEFESKGLGRGDQGAEDDYGTGPAVPRQSEFDREMEETGGSGVFRRFSGSHITGTVQRPRPRKTNCSNRSAGSKSNWSGSKKDL